MLLTVINTWADPALYEVPFLSRLAVIHERDGLVILCVVLDEHVEAVEAFRDQFQPTYPLLRVADRAHFTSVDGPFGAIRMVPTSFLITRSGQIAARMEGTWSPSVLVQAIDRLLADHRHPD